MKLPGMFSRLPGQSLQVRHYPADEHGGLESLLIVETGIYTTAIGSGEICLRQPPGATGALSDVFAREFQMHSAKT